MTIIADETLVGLWCVYFDDGNVMVGVSRPQTGSYTMTARLRLYSTPESGPWDDKDDKHWRQRQMTAPEDEPVIQWVREWLGELRVAYKADRIDELLRGAQTLDAYVERIAALGDAHLRKMTTEEYIAEYGPDAPRPKP